MNLLIFGAGASYGSDNFGPLPALGYGLFDELAKHSPLAWGALPEKYKEIFIKDFEMGMRILSEQNPHSLPPLQRAMASYFFDFYPRATNLYLRLSELIKSTNWNKEGKLVSFNYDRLLPICLDLVKLQPAVGVSEINENQIELCLPHGTCNLFCSGVQALGNVSFNGIGVSFDGGLPQCIVERQSYYLRLQTDKIPPIMSYFNAQKTNASGRNFILNQRKRYNELIQQSEKIAIIGLKVREHDTHIWDSIASTKASIVYCAGKSAGEEFCDWITKNRPKKEAVILKGYFADCFDDICSEMAIT